jgi:hypothetical protein
MVGVIRLGLVGAAVVAGVALAGAATGAGIAYQRTTDFAGYSFYATGVTSASARFTIPRVTCAGGDSGVGPGLFVVTTRHALTGAGIAVACEGGTPTYELITALNNVQRMMPLSVRPKDVLATQIHITGTATVITVRDMRTNIVGRRAGAGARASYVSIGTAAVLLGTVQVGVDRFTPVSFDGVVVQGKALSHWNPGAVERYRGPKSHPIVEIRPGPISAGGEGFTLSFVHR